MSSLDETLINDAAPAGSLRYFSLLYTPAEVRTQLAALYLIDSEIRASARSANHDVAHTRLRWWREEIARLRSSTPQHPATRALAALADGMDFKALFDLLTAAEQDLASVSYEEEREVEAYLRRSGGSTAELAANILLPALNDKARETARTLGMAIRRTETLRDLRQDAHDGRIYFALPTLENANVDVNELNRPTLSEPLRRLVLNQAQRVRSDLDRSIGSFESSDRNRLRPLLVLASLHARLLEHLERDPDDIPKRHMDLAPFEKVWTAWRAASTTKL